MDRLTRFFSNPYNVYGLIILLGLIILQAIFPVLSFGMFILVMSCMGLMNIIYYLLGCKDSAIYYMNNIENLRKMMDSINTKTAKKKEELLKKIRNKLEEDWEEFDNNEYN